MDTKEKISLIIFLLLANLTIYQSFISNQSVTLSYQTENVPQDQAPQMADLPPPASLRYKG